MAGSLITAKVSMTLEGASKVKAQMIAEAKAGATEAGSAGGKAFGDSYTRDASGRLRDSRGKFVAEGGALGKGFSDSFNKNSKIKVDSKDADKSLKTFGADVRNISTGLKAISLGAGGPALVPLLGGASAAAADLGVSLVTAGVGAVGLAAVGIPAAKNIKDALKNAGKEGSAALDSLTPAEQNLYGATHQLTGAYTEFYKHLEPKVLPEFAAGVNTATNTLPRFTGVVDSAAGGLHGFIVQLDTAAGSDTFAQFLSNLSKNAGPALQSSTGFLLDLGQAGAIVFNELAPLTPQVDGLLQTLGNKAVAGVQSQGFIGFLHTIESDAPLAGRVLGDLGHDGADLVAALEPLGRVSLRGLDGALQAIDPLITDFGQLTQAIENNSGALAPVASAYLSLATGGAGLALHVLTDLVGVIGDNATEFQILADAVIAVKIGATVKDALAATKAFGLLKGAVAGAASAETALAAAKGTEAAASTAAGLEKGAAKATGFKGAMQGASRAVGGFNIVGGLAAGVIAGVTFGFSQAASENQQLASKLSSQLDSTTKGLDNLTLSQQANALSTQSMIDSGNGALAILANIGSTNTSAQKYLELRQDTQGLSDAFNTFGKSAGVSGNQLYSMAKQVGYTDDQLTAIGNLASKVELEKKLGLPTAAGDAQELARQEMALYGSIRNYSDAVSQASDPTYNLSQAVKDLNSNAAHDNIKDFNTALENYSTLAIGTTATSAQAGDALSQLKGIFSKNTTETEKNGAAQNVLNNNLLQAGPQTRQFAEQLAGLNGQYTANLEGTFKAAGGAKNLALAGGQVVAVAQQQKHALYDTLLQMGLSAGEASKLAEQYASIPKSLLTQIRTQGAAQAKNDIAGINTAVSQLKPGTVSFKGDDKDVRSKISALEKLLPSLPKSQQIKFGADINTALMKLNDAESRAKAVAKQKYEASLTAQSKQADAKVAEAAKKARGYAGAPYLAHLSADDKVALGKADEARARAQDYASARYEGNLTANNRDALAAADTARARAQDYASHSYAATIGAVNNASGVIGSVSGELGSLNGKTATTYIDTVYRTVGHAAGIGRARAGGGWASGPGSATSDSFLQPTSNGEFTVNAMSARANAALLEAINRSHGPVAVPAVGGGGGGGAGVAQPIVIQLRLPNNRLLAQAVADGNKQLVSRGAYG